MQRPKRLFFPLSVLFFGRAFADLPLVVPPFSRKRIGMSSSAFLLFTTVFSLTGSERYIAQNRSFPLFVL